MKTAIKTILFLALYLNISSCRDGRDGPLFPPGTGTLKDPGSKNCLDPDDAKAHGAVVKPKPVPRDKQKPTEEPPLNEQPQDPEPAPAPPPPPPKPKDPGACAKDDTVWTSADGGCKHVASSLVFSAISNENGKAVKIPPTESQRYCFELEEGGHKDWRQPEETELISVASPSVHQHLNLMGESNLQVLEVWYNLNMIVHSTNDPRTHHWFNLNSGAKMFAPLPHLAHLFCVRKAN